MEHNDYGKENVLEILHWTGELPELVGEIHGVEVCLVPTHESGGQLTYRAMIVSPGDFAGDSISGTVNGECYDYIN